MSNDILTIVPVGNNNNGAAQLLLDVGDSAMIFNTSPVNTLWVGNNPALTTGYQNAVPIAPLGYLVLTAADQPIYGVAAAGIQINVGILPGAVAFFTPQLNATITGPVTIGTIDGNVEVIGNGGIFPAGDNGQLYTGNGGITPGNNLATGIMDGLDYNSYNLSVVVYCAAQANAGAPIVGMVQINWYADAAGSTTLYTDTWWVWAGNSSVNAVGAVGSGPMHGRYFQVQVFNQGTAETLSCAGLVVFGTQRTLAKPVWRQGVPQMTVAAGFTQLATLGAGNAMGTDDVLATNSNQSLAITTKYFLPMPLSAGLIYARFETSAALSGDAALCSADNLQYGQAGGTSGTDPHVLVNFASVAATDYEVTLNAAHAPLFVTISTGAAAPTVNLAVTSQDAG